MPESPYRIEETLDYILGTTVQCLKNALYREFKRENYSITPEQWSVLAKLHHEDGLYQKQVADSLAKDKPTTTRILDLLERKNLIIRISDDKDRRKTKVYLTQEGKNTAKNLIPIAMEFQKKLKENITPHELDLLEKTIQKITENIAKF